MIYEIGEILKTELINEVYVDKIAGIVMVALDTDAEKSTPKRFPISCDVEGKDCIEQGKYSDLVPNSNKKSVIYFEDISGVSRIGNTGARIDFDARPRIVVWLNKTKLGKTDCSIAPIIVANIIKKLEGIKRRNTGQFINMNVEVVNEVPKTPEIFSRYTYNQYQQFLLYPYEYFALTLKVTFSINPNCINDFVLGDVDNCNIK